jgi:hypothetical protein
MRAALHPIGILLGHALPALLLALLYGDMLAVIHPLLEEPQREAWIVFGSFLGCIVLASTVYALFTWRRGTSAHPIYGALVFVAYVPLLWAFAEHMSDLLPWSIPRWMRPEDAELYAFRLLCIPLAHALFILVVSSLRGQERGAPLRDLLIAVGIPLAIFLFVQVVEPFRGSSDFEEHAWLVVMVALVIGFLFFLFRGVVAIVQRVGPVNAALNFIVRLLIAFVFPVLGLAFNNGHIGARWNDVEGVFGDLAHPAFYIIAVLNAVVVLWPSSANPTVRFVQFLLRAVGFSYVLYFFVLFLPLLPLSVVAILAIGIGFLLLAPVLLFIVQTVLLYQDLRFLAAHHARVKLIAFFLGCVLAIPAGITIRYLHHRTVLHAALHHVFQSGALQPVKPLDADALVSVLGQVNSNRSRGRGMNRSGTPFLTPWYNRIVLDNLALSEEKTDVLSAVFLNEPLEEPLSNWRTMPSSAHTTIDSATVRSTYKEDDRAWHSWVDLHIRNSGGGQEEFVTDIALPDGAWIGGHYLGMAGDTVPGILAEKKAAMWVYNNIVSYRRDPSIMRYTGPGQVQLRVFPVEANDMRHTGFEVVHAEGMHMVLGSDTLQLGDHSRDHADVIPAISGGTAYIPASVKATLPLVRRTPHIHFIVDGTEQQRPARGDIARTITRYIAQEKLDTARMTLHIADAYGISLPFGTAALDAFVHHVGHGGFFSDRSIRTIIARSCAQPEPESPVIVIVPSGPSYDNTSYGIWLDDLDDVAACIPEGDSFYVLNENLSPSLHPFNNPTIQLNREPITITVPEVRAWPDTGNAKFYLRDDRVASIIVDMEHLDNLEAPPAGKWQAALELEARWRTHLLRYNAGGSEWTQLVRGAFAAQVLTPVTAWMCLEDEAQRNALLKKQEEVLSGNPSLDASDQELTSMSEPGLVWFLPLLLWILWMKRRDG